ncbi:MAG: hypothetical protein V3T23_12455 [Nitrososphaerales archaeon]
MTVIAWDGKTLAADKQMSRADTIGTCTKIYKIEDGSVLAFCGQLAQGLALMDWYRNGRIYSEWPAFQSSDNWTVLVIAKDGKLIEYEQCPRPIGLEEKFTAWGNGREFAIGALAMGASSVEAVEVTSHHCEGCGRGVDSFES